MAEQSYWSRGVRRGISRRGLLLSGAAAGAGVALVACSGGKSGSGSGSSSQSSSSGANFKPTPGGTLTFASTDPNMWVQTDAAQALIFSVWHWIGRHAIRLDQDSKKLTPLTVASWEIPGDGSQFILHVKPGIKTQNRPPMNGRDYTADDVAWNINRIAGKLDPAHAALYQRATTMYPLDHTEVVDNTTFKVIMSKPSSTFLNGLTEPHNPMMPRDVVEAGLLNNIPALGGHGPFMIKSYAQGGTMSFVKHPNYMLDGLPYLDGIDYLTLPDAATKLSAFISGKIDMYEEPSATDIATVKAALPNANLMNSAGMNWQHLRFQTEKAPFTDARVRRALFLSLDYKAIGDGYAGAGTWQYTGPIAYENPEGYNQDQLKALPGYNPNTKTQDIATAKQLMTSAGFPDGDITFPILLSSALTTGSAYQNATRAQDQWKKVWPKMNVTIQPPPDTATFNKLQSTNDFMMISYTNTAFPDPALEMAAQYHTPSGLLGSRNYGHFKNADADAMIEKALETIDLNARKQILLDFQKQYFDEWMPCIQLYMLPDRYFVGPHFGNFQNLLGPWWFINFRLGTASEYFSHIS